MDDIELVAAAQAGDGEAFMVLVRRYEGALVAAARQMTRSPEDAEDIAQEAVLQAYRSLPSLRERGKFRAWFFAILHRECINYLRTRHGEMLPLEECAELQAEPLSEEEGYLELLNRLPLDQREILIARYLYELSYEQMAEIFGSSEQTMRTRCFRARAQLRMLAEQEEEETRRVLQGVMSSLVAGFPLESFMQGISGRIALMPPPAVPPSVPPAVPPAAAPASGAAHAGFWTATHLAALKLIGGAVIALSVAALVLPRLPLLRHHRHVRHIAATMSIPNGQVAIPATPLSSPVSVKPAVPARVHPRLAQPPRRRNPHSSVASATVAIRQPVKTQSVIAASTTLPAAPAAIRQPVKTQSITAASTRMNWTNSSFSGSIAYSPVAPLIAAVQ